MIKDDLLKLQDTEYRDFHAKLMPTISKDRIIGVRIPALRKYAKEIRNSEIALEFLQDLPHTYYEENNLHAFLIEGIKAYGECITEINKFLPYVDNWATCDSLNPRILKKYPEELLIEIERWLGSDHTYTLRFAMKMLMTYYLDANFKAEYLEKVVSVSSDDYYVKMMKAWYFATALAKQYDYAIIYLKEKRLSVWEHNKTIQKAIESYRISDEKKTELKELRIKQ